MSEKKDRPHMSASTLYEILLRVFTPDEPFFVKQAAEQWNCSGDLARARLFCLTKQGMTKKWNDGRYSLYDEDDRDFFGKDFPKDPEHEGWMHFVNQQRTEKQRMGQWQKYS